MPQLLFSDDFKTDGPIDGSEWHFNDQSDGGWFYGRTQQRQELPTASGGVMRLKLDSFNESDPNRPRTSFLGSEAISYMKFTREPGGGPWRAVAFEADLKYEQPQRGIVCGSFSFVGPAATHNEIDFEAMSNSFDQVLTLETRPRPPGR